MIEIKHKITGDVLREVNDNTLIGADLSYSNLQGANLRYSNLRCANLRDSNLYGASLRDSNLGDSNLRGANLEGAYLHGANLEGADLEGAKGIMQWQAPQGEKRICYSVKHDNCVMHKLGCFWGDTDEAVRAIREKYGNNSMYEQILLLNAKALK